ncbi:carboxylesterase/lipase family protein [Nonomuraea mangrovi]|uniref:Carboxylic ester hydrolase n=1 Tax=Nonomuraea mangrovi TaxID=2316207 RepID=A0ABW4T9D4_9ACTN
MIVDTRYGKLRGRIEGDVAVFRGVPYAAPPFGDLRFRAPQRPEPWEGVRDALEDGPTAPKRPYPPPLDAILPEVRIEGEDCLNLNVWTPDLSGRRPVMVWVHGGSNRNGSNSVPVYDGGAFARSGVVLVSINYRLGVEGFCSFPDAPENRGLLDQVAALEWVRDNIAAFGGDPGNVTLFGESAGAIDIAALLAAPSVAGLFSRAILQSGPPAAGTREEARKTTAMIAKRLGVPATAAAFAAVDLERLLDAQVEVARKSSLMGGPGFGPVLDGELLTGLDLDPDKPVIFGQTSEEYRLWFVPTGLAARLKPYMVRLALLKLRVRGGVLKGYRALHPRLSPGEAFGLLLTDHLLRVPLRKLAETRPEGRTWLYEFAWRSPAHELGAAHAMELPFVFATTDTPEAQLMTGRETPSSLTDAMHGAWVRFAETGDPGWPSWSEPARPTMVFDEDSRVVGDHAADVHALWRR